MLSSQGEERECVCVCENRENVCAWRDREREREIANVVEVLSRVVVGESVE